MARENIEESFRDALFEALYTRLGDGGRITPVPSGSFRLAEAYGGGTCAKEGPLNYRLPDGTERSHKNDILVTLLDGSLVAIELKVRSAVSDQFKCRAYDMIHIKQSMRSVCGVMVYFHFKGAGISVALAQSYSYPFDKFLGFEVEPEGRGIADAVIAAADEITRLVSARPRNSQ